MLNISFIKYQLIFSFLIILPLFSQYKVNRGDVEVKFNKDAQIEVGSHYVGAEFHHGFPLPQRISFYYPVANSIDLSNDYWKRDSTFVMIMGLKENDNETEWFNSPFEFTSTPYSVDFFKSDSSKNIEMSYDFCLNKPAMVLTVEVTNLTSTAKEYSVYSDLQTSLRTSHSYKLKSSAQSEHITQSYEDGSVSSVFTNFDDIETKYAQVFVLNAGEKPVSFSTESSLTDFRKDSPYYLINELKNKSSLPAAAFVYRKKIAPGEKLKVVQIIGSCRKDEREDITEYLFRNYKAEVEGYEQYVLNEINTDLFLTGDPVLDKSIIWAKGILAVNQHYIDGSIQPMPCPAEYNFYFTHDVLLTDLAVVKFNPARVKRDLEFILEHSENNIIPHAYYWKDSSYLTEYASPDNWNHFWFIILSAEYLRKSDDAAFLRLLYPCLVKSIGETMQNLKEDLIWAYQPDWWDIGSKWGPRAYMTILAIKALNDFSDISRALGRNKDEFSDYSGLAVKMQKALNKKLWNNDKKYLMNYFGDGSEDPHFYTGSLLAVHFNLLDKDKAVELTETASHYLLDEKIGIYNVYPMDFHELTGFWEFVGNEAGDQFKYINGGVWPHGNAWYALALSGTGKKNEAVEFIKKTMTIDGIINSPNGQPAMYEYRNSNKNSSEEYGKVDKPQFMWAAGWYLYCIRELFLN